MSDRVPELRELPSGLVLDGELVAFKEQGAPHWPLLCAYTRAELDALEGELGPEQGPIVAFAAATGLRPQEWLPLERRDIDRARRVLRVERVVSDGEVRHVGKTARSLREVPLSRRALDALDRLPPRLDKTLLFPTPNGGLLNLTTWRRHAWTPAVDAAGIAKPARIYDLRSTWRRLRSDATSPAAAARAANSSSAVLIVILAWADRSLRCSWSFHPDRVDRHERLAAGETLAGGGDAGTQLLDARFRSPCVLAVVANHDEELVLAQLARQVEQPIEPVLATKCACLGCRHVREPDSEHGRQRRDERGGGYDGGGFALRRATPAVLSGRLGHEWGTKPGAWSRHSVGRCEHSCGIAG
jgi:hypothetical protein